MSTWKTVWERRIRVKTVSTGGKLREANTSSYQSHLKVKPTACEGQCVSSFDSITIMAIGIFTFSLNPQSNYTIDEKKDVSEVLLFTQGHKASNSKCTD